MSRKDIATRNRRLAERIGQVVGLKGHSLRETLRRAGRAIPRHVRRDIEVLSEAEARSEHPKLSRQIDVRQVEAAYARAERWIEVERPGLAFRQAARGFLTANALNIVIVAAIVLAVLVLRGLV